MYSARQLFASRMARGIILACVAAFHLGVTISIALQDKPVIWRFHNDTVYRLGKGADFYSVYHAGVNMQNDQSPYKDKADGVTPYFYYFRYLPIVGVAAERLLRFSPQTAYTLWIIALEIMLAILLYVLHRRLENKTTWFAAAALLLLSSPFFLELYMGQFTFFTAALCALALLLPLGWLTYTIAVLLKIFPLVMLPSFVRDRRKWIFGIVSIAALLAFSVPHFYQHPNDWFQFVNRNLEETYGSGSGSYGFLELVQLVMGDISPDIYSSHWPSIFQYYRFILLAASALLVVFSKKQNTILTAATLLLAHFMSYIHVWEHHISGVMVIGALALVACEDDEYFQRVVLLCMLFLALPTPFVFFNVVENPPLAGPGVYDPSGGWPRYYLYLLAIPKAIPTLIMFGACAGKLIRAGFDSPLRVMRDMFAKDE